MIITTSPSYRTWVLWWRMILSSLRKAGSELSKHSHFMSLKSFSYARRHTPSPPACLCLNPSHAFILHWSEKQNLSLWPTRLQDPHDQVPACLSDFLLNFLLGYCMSTMLVFFKYPEIRLVPVFPLPGRCSTKALKGGVLIIIMY